MYGKIVTFSEGQNEKDDAARWLAQLVGDDSRMEMLDPGRVGAVHGVVGTMLLGHSNTRFESAFPILLRNLCFPLALSFCTSPTVPNLKRGAKHQMQCGAVFIALSQLDQTNGYIAVFYFGLGLESFTCLSLNTIALSAFKEGSNKYYGTGGAGTTNIVLVDELNFFMSALFSLCFF